MGRRDRRDALSYFLVRSSRGARASSQWKASVTAAAAPASAALQLRAKAPSWIEVQDANSQVLLSRHLKPGETVELKPLKRWPRVVAIVPARNEAETIARCVASLAAQNYGGELSIIIVDDHSDDGTAVRAMQAAASFAAADRVFVHSAAALPAGWTGKLWALNEGVARAAETAAAFFGGPYHISPQETWTLPRFFGVVKGALPEDMPVKLQAFYGQERPAEARFTLRVSK